MFICYRNLFINSKIKFLITLSIVIPTLNNYALLQKCVDSIANQSFKNFEVWIIDGGSTDGTLEFLESLPSRFKYISETDTGIYNAMNKGVVRAAGEWLYFLGADDILNSNEVLSVVNHHFNGENKILLGNIRMDSTVNKKILHSSFNYMLWIKNSIHHQGAFYHKSIFENRRYDESLKVLADYKLNLELLKAQLPHKQIDKTIARCGTHGISKKYNWSLYQEEIRLKKELSSNILGPLFFVLGFLKYSYKNM